MPVRLDDIFVHVRHLNAEVALHNAPLARAVTALRVDRDSSVVPVDAEFYAFAARYPNLRLLKTGPWSFTSVPGHLPVHPIPFSKLTTCCVAWENNTWLTVDSLFGVLSMMPALKKLAFGITDMRLLDDLDDHELRAQSLPTPACSLTHLVVHDDGDANFWHYSLLLSRSHDTLEHIGLHWIFDSEGGVEIREALLQCTRVRHLTLEGNEFDNALINSACPRLQARLALTAAEMAALQAPLFSLELANCFGDMPQHFVTRVSARLRDIIADTPSLGTICFDFIIGDLQRETEAYRELRALCKERRIHLSTVPTPRVMFL